MPEEREHQALVPDADRGSLLVVRSDGAARLPSARGRPGGAAALQAFERELSLGVAYLRPAGILRDESGTPFAALHELDAPGLEWEPPRGAHWLSLDEAAPESLAPQEWTPAIARWLDEQRGAPIPESRAQWARPGWLSSASRWLVESAIAAGLEPAGGVELEQQWPLSSVLRLDTDGGRVFFKAAFPLFQHEPAVALALADRHPTIVPRVLAVDRRRGWMLMHELSGELLGDTGVESWGEGLRLLARLHRTWVGRDGDLLALGGQDRTLRSLALELAGVLEAVDLPGDERDRLERALPRLREACSALASGPLPQTLVHGDFHPWNLMLGRGELRIFDWSDACVAHPLFDLPTFLERTDDEAAREGLLHAYLEGWADVAPLDELRALAEIAEPLAHVHHAVSYLRILDALEPDDRWYFAGEPRRWLLGAVELVEAVR